MGLPFGITPQRVTVQGSLILSREQFERLLASGDPLYLEARSLFGHDWHGLLKDAPVGMYYIGGPDQLKPKWTAVVIKAGNKIIVR